MAIAKIPVEIFIDLATNHLVLDVRSDGEYAHAHIPGAISLPLFNDEERKIVGTAYKQQSREQAIKIGLDFFGKKMRPMVEAVENLVTTHTRNNPGDSKNVMVHCWRGGMRSAAVAWLLDLYGFRVSLLIGGYKAYRNWVLQQFDRTYPFNVLGGYTGSGKTLVLHQLAATGEAIIDLEGIAGHKGSAFGNIGLPVQPTQEMFDNLFAKALYEQGNNIAAGKRVWLEDESQRIGLINIPIQLWRYMRGCPLYFIEIDFEERLQFIIQDYGKGQKEQLLNAIVRIQKRLGGLETKTAVNFLLEDNLQECFRILLKYYDKHYSKALHNREALGEILVTIACTTVDAKQNAVAVAAATKLKI